MENKSNTVNRLTASQCDSKKEQKRQTAAFVLKEMQNNYNSMYSNSNTNQPNNQQNSLFPQGLTNQMNSSQNNTNNNQNQNNQGGFNLSNIMPLLNMFGGNKGGTSGLNLEGLLKNSGGSSAFSGNPLMSQLFSLLPQMNKNKKNTTTQSNDKKIDTMVKTNDYNVK